MDDMQSPADRIKLREKLHRHLTGTKAEFDERDVRAYFCDIIAPLISAAGIRHFSMVLRRRDGAVITAELQEGFLGDYERYVRLVEAASGVGCSYFKLNTNDGTVIGYAENDWDWVLLKYDNEAHAFLEPIDTDFWSPFFDFV
jgi:hypothetical protein